MAMHNDTCGCADCGNYGQPYNPRAIHNQSCGCEECGNYAQASHVQSVAAQPTSIAAVSTSQEPCAPSGYRVRPNLVRRVEG